MNTTKQWNRRLKVQRGREKVKRFSEMLQKTESWTHQTQTGDGKANRCSFVLKKKKRRHKLLLSYLGIKWSLTITTATTSEDSPPQKKQWWKPKTKNFAQSIGIFTLTTQQLWQNTFKFVSNFYRDSLSSRNILHLLGKTSCYPVRIQTTESKAWLDMNGFFDKQHYMFLFWKQWCLPY